MEGEAEDLGAEVDGVAGQLSVWPVPVAVLDDEAGILGGFEVAGPVLDEIELAFLEDRQRGSHPRDAYLFAGPTGLLGAIRGVCGHGIVSSGVA